jgi:hypothetical protein
MSFFKSLVRRVKRTVKAQVTSQVTGFVGRAASSVTSAATSRVTGAVNSRIGGTINTLKDRVTAAGVASRRSGLNPFANAAANRVAKGAIARAKGEKIVDPFG